MAGLLLTAFAPYEATGRNASAEICRRFMSRHALEIAGRCNVMLVVLPVVYDEDTRLVERALDEFHADALIHTGQAPGAAEIRLEATGRNLRYAPSSLVETAPGADPVAARTPDRVAILPGGPESIQTTLPADTIASAAAEARLPLVRSDDAGCYLCNHVLYRSLLRQAGSSSAPPALFLHMPLLADQAPEGVPSLDLDVQATTLRFVAEQVLDAL